MKGGAAASGLGCLKAPLEGGDGGELEGGLDGLGEGEGSLVEGAGFGGVVVGVECGAELLVDG